MPVQQSASTENNFKKGLITEFTGLNFPEDAASDTDNCIYNIIGEVTRREGFDFEANFTANTINGNQLAKSTYRWKNAGGDGVTQFIVVQIGGFLYFFNATSATTSSPLSAHKAAQNIDISSFVATGGSFDTSKESQFADGNGYLFVFHPNCDPFFITYSSSTLTATRITVQIRDVVGVPDNLAVTYRPLSLSNEHLYNLYNQGWSNAAAWSTTSTSSVAIGTGAKVFVIPTTNPVPTSGDPVIANGPIVLGGSAPSMQGSVTSYTGNATAGGNLTISSVSTSGSGTFTSWTIYKPTQGLINTWVGTVGNYPANSDIWWRYKSVQGFFNSTSGLGSVYSSVTQPQAQAPQGSFILSAFNQQRSLISGVSSITDVSTTVRPRTGAWMEGRIWYSGVDASFPVTGDQPFSTWSENIYFSQIVTGTDSFGLCYQANDPTDENLFDLLPSDGGVIQIQGSGPIYRLVPVINGMIVFAANGIWFITGNQGIGFRATDYTITKISGVRSISGTSFVSVNGWPMFWGEEGIFAVAPGQTGKLEVNNICLGTILSYYNDIPIQSKKYARGDYDPINFTVQWLFRTTDANTAADNYVYDAALNLNIHNKAFYPYSFSSSEPHIFGVVYVESPGGLATSSPVFKYPTTYSNGDYFTFSEERDSTNWVDFTSSGTGLDYTSFFVTGDKLRPIRHPYLGLYGQAPHKWAPVYVWMWTRGNSSYQLQSIWDFGVTGDSGRWSNPEQVIVSRPSAEQLLSTRYRRHKIRGHGRAMQLRVNSVSGKPFTFIGWSQTEQQYIGV